MTRPNEKTLKAFINIRQNQDWLLIREWIQDSANENLVLSAKVEDDIVIKRKQGAAVELMEILSIQDAALTLLPRAHSTQGM